MRATKWFFRNWYWFNGAIAVIAAIILFTRWGDYSVVQRIMLGQFVFMNLHFIEEFVIPGGFPLIANTAEKPSDKPSHWPLNQWNACAGNNWFAFMIYLPAFVFCEQEWLVMTVTMFGFIEVLMHAVAFNALLRAWFNPGLVTSVLGFLPLSITYLAYAYSRGFGPAWWMYLVGIAIPMVNYFVIFQWLLCGVLASRETRFPFTYAEMQRGERWVAKFRALKNQKTTAASTNSAADATGQAGATS